MRFAVTFSEIQRQRTCKHEKFYNLHEKVTSKKACSARWYATKLRNFISFKSLIKRYKLPKLWNLSPALSEFASLYYGVCRICMVTESFKRTVANWFGANFKYFTNNLQTLKCETYSNKLCANLLQTIAGNKMKVVFFTIWKSIFGVLWIILDLILFSTQKYNLVQYYKGALKNYPHWACHNKSCIGSILNI